MLYILGYIKSYAFMFIDKPSLYMVLDNSIYEEIPLFFSQHSCYWTKMHTNKFWAFDININLTEVRNLKFVVKFKDKEISTGVYFSNKQSINPKMQRGYIKN